MVLGGEPMDVETFIARWKNREGGAERANAAMYLLELTQALDLPAPHPAGADTAHNDYVFERAVRSPFCDAGPPNRIDLYKRSCFLLEAKQSRWTSDGAGQAATETPGRADNWRAPSARRWEAMMRRARIQAHAYVGLLPPDHPAPPFLIICDVARVFEIWADFSGTGRGYAPFPDRHGFRIAHEALARPAIRARLQAIWTPPHALTTALCLHHDTEDGLRRPVRPRPRPTSARLGPLPSYPLRFHAVSSDHEDDFRPLYEGRARGRPLRRASPIRRTRSDFFLIVARTTTSPDHGVKGCIR